MKKIIWLLIMVGAVALNAVNSNLAYAAGATLPWFLLGLFLSSVWWLLSKWWRKHPWKWFHWLNVAAYTTVLLFVAQIAIHSSMETMLSRLDRETSRDYSADQLEQLSTPRGAQPDPVASYQPHQAPASQEDTSAPKSPRRIEDNAHFGIEYGDGRAAIIEGDIDSLRENMRRGLQDKTLGY